MEKYVCRSCWYTYDPVAGDPKGGVAPGTPFEEVSEDWFCPICMMTKENFLPLAQVEKEAKNAEIEPENKDLSRYQCKACWYVYDPRVGDPKAGIAPGTPFEDLPEDWFCPICMLTKEQFTQIKMTDPLAEEKKEAPPEKAKDLKRHHCKACWYTYDPRVGDERAGVAPGTPFEDLPEDWFCPICMMGKDYFEVE